jgi:hypothetical protein
MVDDPNSRDSVNCLESLLGWLMATAAQPGWGRMANAKSIGWSIYAAGFVIWLFGYLSAGHASIFHWDMATPWWISSFVPNLEAELGLALMFASMIPIYWRVVRERALARLFVYTAGRAPRVVGFFSVANLVCDLGGGACQLYGCQKWVTGPQSSFAPNPAPFRCARPNLFGRPIPALHCRTPAARAPP